MVVEPRPLLEVISVTSAILPNCFSSGVATDDAMVSGLAPGNWAATEIVGKSTAGRGATGRSRKATAPESATAAVSSVVAMGRRMNGSEIFMERKYLSQRRKGRKEIQEIYIELE